MSTTPLPGRPAKGSRTGRPLFALLDLMTRRWSMRIVWELQGHALTFLELQRECDGMSSSTLTLRLRELTEAKLVARQHDGSYELSSLGAALPAAFGPLVSWAEEWADATAADHSVTEGRELSNSDASPTSE
ncbi:transcriptional regulator [Cryobacterium sp. LW097]|uniref:winged helix-turn-helix transcriptional regulator n=1 Tax=unclassified Cryobacterium TaxID=2649013 RepID=UPI000B4D5BEE|nr:transcriptional regulator [Cryobacterium sp. LW097]TFC57480.1 transcriptional regulator [Cryobacterium sp. TMB1-7]TFC90002.1 transcriptional regulator [Cryobacterium sp. TMT4-31]